MSELLLLLFGILCILYGLMVRAIVSGTHFFAVWLVSGCLLILLAWLVRIRFFAGLPAAVRLLLAGTAGAGAFLACICLIIVIRGFFGSASGSPEYLIVPGAQVREDGPSTVLKYRLDEAAEYMRTHDGVLCIVSGGRGYNEPVTEASSMKEYLMEQGIAEPRILVEDRAENTVQNIRFAMAFLPSEDVPVGIVTNNFHIARAVAIAKKQGLVNAGGMPAYSTPFFLPNNVLREIFGLVKDFLAGNL